MIEVIANCLNINKQYDWGSFSLTQGFLTLLLLKNGGTMQVELYNYIDKISQFISLEDFENGVNAGDIDLTHILIFFVKE